MFPDGHLDFCFDAVSSREPAATSLENAIASRSVRRLVGAAIEHADLLFRHHLVERHCRGLEVALGHISRLEMAVIVLAAHQRGPVARADRLLQMGRDVADRQAWPGFNST
jgi:hypothetical protein